MSEGGNFEEILSALESSDDIGNHAVSIVREEIARADWRAMLDIARCDNLPPLSELFKCMLQSSNREVQVVTTNYDRIAECAAEKAGYGHYTGFTHGYLRQQGVDNTPSRRINKGVVHVWKVHGSVDWFYRPCESKEIVALPISDGNPGQGWTPAIILPGRAKYQRAHTEPFRTILAKSGRGYR